MYFVVSLSFSLVIQLSVQVMCLIVQTENGVLSGTTYRTVEGKQVEAFLGVPYAMPPVGERRFKEPRPMENWGGVRTAHNFSSECAQINYYGIHTSEQVTGDEDCLYLDVYTPTVSQSAKLDVIFHIHGGGFMFGSGHEFLPDFILQRHSDVVFVSINYRLGPFGFLTTEDGVIPGNIGLKDQVQALKWVRNNIEQFGGDKNKVTIVGLSAGGSSVHFHYLSPLSRDLFKQGISASGSAFCPWALADNSNGKAQLLAKSLECPVDQSKKLLDCLLKKSAKNILIQVKKLFIPWHYNPFSPFAAVVEKPSDLAFLSKNPHQLLKEGKVKNAPWLASVTTEEGLFPASHFVLSSKILNDLNDNWNRIAPHLLDYNFTVAPENLDRVSEEIKSFYLGEKKISKETGESLIQMLSDRHFVADLERTARLQASVTTSPVYFYKFGYRGNPSVSKILCNCKPPVHLGSSHGDDFLFAMKTNFDMSALEEEGDREMVNTMTGLWMSFVKSGVPSLGVDVDWTPVSPQVAEKGDFSYVMVYSSKDVKKMYSEDLGNRKFWDSLPLQELWNFKNNDDRSHDEF